jgi:hypothetical protein
MLSSAALDGDRSVRIWKKGSRYFAAIDDLAIFGSGETQDAAMSELDRRFVELRDFAETSGLALDTLAPTVPIGKLRWASTLTKAAIVVICVGLITIPLSYGLSTALQRTIDNLHFRDSSVFWKDLDEGLTRMADPANGPSTEEQAETIAALQTLVKRAQPYAEAIKPIFGCTHPQ